MSFPETTIPRGDAAVAAYAAEFPACAQWLETAAARGFDFAKSLLTALKRYGALTAGQHAAVERCAQREATRASTAPAQRTGAPFAPRPAAPALAVPALHAVLQRHSSFHAGDLTLSRRNADQLVWIKHAAAEKVIGKIDDGAVTLWARDGVDLAAVREVLTEFEGAPLQTAMRFGRMTGRCCSCGRELTDPASIDAGIGPICAQRFQ